MKNGKGSEIWPICPWEKAFPGGSRSRVNQAGDNIRNNSYGSEDLAIVEDWRAAHRAVLNTFQAILRNRTRKTDIVVAQRHKRRSTIFGKLKRYPDMQLSRMDDVAGCRLIFSDIKTLYIKHSFTIKEGMKLINMTI